VFNMGPPSNPSTTCTPAKAYVVDTEAFDPMIYYTYSYADTAEVRDMARAYSGAGKLDLYAN